MWTLLLGLAPLGGCTGDVEDTASPDDLGPGRAADLGVKLRGSLEGELAGVSVAGDFDFNGDGQADVAVGAMLADAKQPGGGRACVFLGPVHKDLSLKQADDCWSGSTEDHLYGRDVEGLGDLDGDGLDELAVGAVHDDRGGPNSGMVAVLWGATELSQSPMSVVAGPIGGGHMGLQIAALEGTGQFAVGAHETILEADEGTVVRGEGAAWVIDAPTRDEESTAAELGVLLGGVRADDRAGTAVGSPGDMNGDGLPDLVVGASQAREVDDGAQVGAVYVVHAPFEGDMSLADAERAIHGDAELAWFGWAVAGLGDVDGDGLGDFASSAFKDGANGTDAGAVYVFSGALPSDTDTHSATATLLGEWSGDKAGEVLARGGDFDGDGRSELLVGAPTAGHRKTWAGALYVVRGPFEGLRTLGEGDDLWVGTDDLQFVGASAAGAGDVSGDARRDVIVGAMGDTASTGAAFLITAVGW